ncbi:MAG TPA: hypothetical protein VGH38_15755 [Bryobacteraceae bacterium]|jgi:hypothetical protein
MTDPLAQALSQLKPALVRLGIRYVVVGSLASSARGVYRATADGDLLAELSPGHAGPLAEVLGPDWYADPDMIERSIRDRRSFNIIHIPTAQKIDIFPATTVFHTSQMQRATPIPVFPGEVAMEFPVASAEDIVLAKLQWYRGGGEVSDRQWNDITGLLATNPDLDTAYLNSWAARLHVEDLLAKAVAEVAND